MALKPEERARAEIDRLLTAAGWHVQDAKAADLHAGLGVAIREFALKDGHGCADYMLYVDGNLAINGNFIYRGLIYIEGNLDINGTCWILGGIMVKGQTRIKIANGDCTVLYSSAAISQNIAKYGGRFVTLSWRETN